MALITCRECGAQVSAEAPVCPKCGIPSPAGASARLVVEMPKKFGSDPNVIVTVDDKLQERLFKGSEVTFDLAPGEHTFEVTTELGESWSGTFDLAHEEVIRAAVQSTGFPKTFFVYVVD